MPRTATFTTVTPLPAGITRKSVMDMYEDHLSMIDLNPLVVERFKCRPPSYAVADEYFASWYTIKDKVSYLPGGLAQGSVSYHACFHDTAEGLETHVYAPLGLDIRGRWSVGGALPGERKPPTEKGIKTPRHGLYIREDVTMTCSSLLMSFVKRTFKDSHARLVEKLVDRAHLLESNFANERLRALRKVEPGERMAIGDIFIAPPPDYRPWGYTSPYLQSPSQSSLPSPRALPNSAPTSSSSPLQRKRSQTTSSPRHLKPAQSSHTRCHSDPIPSPGFSSTSTLVSESDRPDTPPKDAAFKFALINPISTPAPAPVFAPAAEPNLYLLPSTAYDGGRSDRLISLHPATGAHSRNQSAHSRNQSAHSRNQSASSIIPPRISYTPEERPISFTFTNSSPFDTHSRTSRSTNPNHNLLDEIDDAIDQVFLYSVSSHTSAKTENTEILLPATKYEPEPKKKKMSNNNDDDDDFVLPAVSYEAPGLVLSAKKYEPEKKTYENDLAKRYVDDLAKQPPVVLPGKTYQQHARKDSVVPWTDKELPPVPIDG